MTVHGAKGLEFEVVAVADLGRNLQLGWSPLRVQPGEEGPEGGELARVGVQLGRLGRPAARLHDYQELADLAAERDAEEEARLAYVAATRAKRRLILSGTFNPDNALKKESTPAQADRPPADPLAARRRGHRPRDRDLGGGRRLSDRAAAGQRERAGPGRWGRAARTT